MRAAGKRTELCSLDAIGDPGAKGFLLSDEDGLPVKMLVVRKGKQVRGYVNRCPHNGIPLDFMPDDFFDLTRRYIQCATHGAVFEIADGLCIEGPCRGKRLEPFAVSVDGERVFAEST